MPTMLPWEVVIKETKNNHPGLEHCIHCPKKCRESNETMKEFLLTSCFLSSLILLVITRAQLHGTEENKDQKSDPSFAQLTYSMPKLWFLCDFRKGQDESLPRATFVFVCLSCVFAKQDGKLQSQMVIMMVFAKWVEWLKLLTLLSFLKRRRKERNQHPFILFHMWGFHSYCLCLRLEMKKKKRVDSYVSNLCLTLWEVFGQTNTTEIPQVEKK